MAPPNMQTIEHYRNAVAAGLARAHSCPPEVVVALMEDYDDVLRGCWSIGAAPIGLIKLLYAEWKTFRASQ